jgi:hypothetical protein
MGDAMHYAWFVLILLLTIVLFAIRDWLDNGFYKYKIVDFETHNPNGYVNSESNSKLWKHILILIFWLFLLTVWLSLIFTPLYWFLWSVLSGNVGDFNTIFKNNDIKEVLEFWLIKSWSEPWGIFALTTGAFLAGTWVFQDTAKKIIVNQTVIALQKSLVECTVTYDPDKIIAEWKQILKDAGGNTEIAYSRGKTLLEKREKFFEKILYVMREDRNRDFERVQILLNIGSESDLEVMSKTLYQPELEALLAQIALSADDRANDLKKAIDKLVNVINLSSKCELPLDQPKITPIKA